MIESTFLTLFRADTELKSYVTEYTIPESSPVQKVPAIFNNSAPKGALKPYLIFRITERKPDFPGAANFVLQTDFLDYDVSSGNSRKASERIKNLIDYRIFEHQDYSCIRPEFSSGGPIEETDPRTVRYNQLFTIRAFRKAWMNQL